MNISVLSPEFNTSLIPAGAGPAPVPEAAASWNGVAGELASVAISFDPAASGPAAAPGQCLAYRTTAGATAPPVVDFSMNYPAVCCACEGR
ncbi:PPE domain-containing protein [Mycobacterium paraense]|uniref:PPE domain-containing protein n=1 Tax=Mycobacterium paraense TaxID=767916 RepID=UPI000A15E2AD|nr:PPE domain-containing protein [Mycobacterium paraense]